MAVIIELNYGKKLGLPEYSSHNFSVSLKPEVANLEDVHSKVARTYQVLQSAVDEQIINPGFVPGAQPPASNGGNGKMWKCSDKQKELILKMVEEHNLDRTDIDQLSIERFGHGVTQLNKLEASGLIDELMVKTGRCNGRRNGGNRTQALRRAA